MSCGKCKREGRPCEGTCETGAGPECWPTSGGARLPPACDANAQARGAERLARWAACEAWCGPCCVAGAKAPAELGELLAIFAAKGLVTLRGGEVIYNGVCYSDACLVITGQSWNMQARTGFASPADAKAITAAFSRPRSETITLPPSEWADLGGGYYALRLPAFGLSHVFCLYQLALVAVLPEAPAPLPVTEMGVAGERAVCGVDTPGSYKLALSEVVLGDPLRMATTQERCSCDEPICAAIPAESGEVLVVRVPIGIPIGATLGVTLTASRCDWLLPVEEGVSPQGQRLAPFTTFAPSRFAFGTDALIIPPF